MVKHLEVQGYALAELALRHPSQSLPSLRSNQDTVSADLSGQVGGVTGIPGQAVEAPTHSESRGGVTGQSVCWLRISPLAPVLCKAGLCQRRNFSACCC